MVTNNEFLAAIKGIHQQAQRVLVPETATLKSIVRATESMASTEHTPEIEERALSGAKYQCTYPDQLSNSDFTGGLGSWTESIESGITATTAAESGATNVFSLQASMEALKIDMTDGDTNNNVVERYQDIAAVASEIWNVEVYAYVSALSGARTVLRIDFLDAGLSSLANNSVNIAAPNSDFAQMKLENQVAPASTAWIRVRLQIEVTSGPNATGTVYFDKARAEESQTTISARANRIICGEWVCRT